MKKKTCFVMLAALMMAGCSNEVEEQVMDSRRVPLQINGDINMLMTRAADGHWDANDAIGVYMVNAENGIVDNVSNYRYVTGEGNGSFSPDGAGNTAYFPEGGEAVNVVAYYPQGDVVDNKLSLDLSDQSVQPDIDLMSAKAEGASKSNPAVKLEFKHRLTKLFFVIEGDVNTDGIEATISNQYTKIQYDILNDKLLIADESKQDIVMKYWNRDEGTNRFVEAIVLPNDENNSAEDRKLTFKLNEKTFKATISNSTKFEAGKKYIYKVKFEQTSSGNINVSITGVGIKNWDDINDSEGNTIIPGTLKFDKLYLASGFTSWSEPYEMTKSDEKTFTWTGNIIEDIVHREMKFTLLQQSISGDVQLMPNTTGTVNTDVTLNTEMNAYPVIYRESDEGSKRDNKWNMPEDNGTYTVTVNVETMKVKVEKLVDVVYLVGTALTGGYDLKKAPYFTKNSEGKYELTVNLQVGDFKIISQLNYDSNKSDYFAPENGTSFQEGELTVNYRPINNQDYKWQVAEGQTGTYKLTLDVSDSSNVTLTAEKL